MVQPGERHAPRGRSGAGSAPGRAVPPPPPAAASLSCLLLPPPPCAASSCRRLPVLPPPAAAASSCRRLPVLPPHATDNQPLSALPTSHLFGCAADQPLPLKEMTQPCLVYVHLISLVAQLINHFPNHAELTRKDLMVRATRCSLHRPHPASHCIALHPHPPSHVPPPPLAPAAPAAPSTTTTRPRPAPHHHIPPRAAPRLPAFSIPARCRQAQRTAPDPGGATILNSIALTPPGSDAARNAMGVGAGEEHEAVPEGGGEGVPPHDRRRPAGPTELLPVPRLLLASPRFSLRPPLPTPSTPLLSPLSSLFSLFSSPLLSSPVSPSVLTSPLPLPLPLPLNMECAPAHCAALGLILSSGRSTLGAVPRARRLATTPRNDSVVR